LEKFKRLRHAGAHVTLRFMLQNAKALPTSMPKRPYCSDIERLARSEARFKFLDALSHATRTLTDASDIMGATARLLGQHLNVSRCAYALS
jgi:hypothetical protein